MAYNDLVNNYKNNDHRDRSGNVYVDISDAVSGLYRFANFTRAAVKKASQQYAEEAETYMKKNAPWNDRTKKAREGLKAEYFEHGSSGLGYSVGVRLKHTVKYGIYLEYNGLYNRDYRKRRRAILVPTLKSTVSKSFFKYLKQQFSKIHKV